MFYPKQVRRSPGARTTRRTALLDHGQLPLPATLDAKYAAQKLAKRGLRIARTAVGKGVFATKRIVDGSCIGEIEGRVIDDEDYVSRYAFDLDDGTQLEPIYPFRYVNHSCEPNCAFESFAFDLGQALPRRISSANPRETEKPRKLLLFAICDITIGEELTIDYNWPACFAIPCQCRAALCRGWIVAPQDLSQMVV